MAMGTATQCRGCRLAIATQSLGQVPASDLAALLEHGIVPLGHGLAFLQLLPALAHQHRRRTETAAPWGQRRSAAAAGSQSQHRALVRVPMNIDLSYNISL